MTANSLMKLQSHPPRLIATPKEWNSASGKIANTKRPEMETNNISSPIRWAGSKKRLLGLLAKRLPVTFERYIEPFAGSACLLFYLQPRTGIIADTNQELIRTWRVIRDSPGKLFARLKTGASKRAYYALRRRRPESMGMLDRAARFLYLNRLCFNGVYRVNRHGMFNVPMGSRTPSSIDWKTLQNCSRILKTTEILAQDYRLTLEMVRRGDFVYLDPPYVAGGRPLEFGIYGLDCFARTDIMTLMKLLVEIDKRGAKFMLSYCLDETVEDAMRAFNIEIIQTTRYVAGFAAKRRKYGEMLVTNYNDGKQ